MNADNKRERSHLGELIVQELIERTEDSTFSCPDCGYPVFDLPEEGKMNHCIHCNDNYLKARVGNTLDL